jgi:hypothetical protein
MVSHTPHRVIIRGASDRPNAKHYSACLHVCRVEWRPIRRLPAQTLPNDISSAATAVVVESPDGAAVGAGRERRVSEQLITDWDAECRRLGHALAFMTFDAAAMTGPKWAHRFIIAVSPVVEHSSLLFYGPCFASLLELPAEIDKSVPISAQLPARYMSVFTRGCVAASLSGTPIRIQGEVERDDGMQELYRAAFIRLSVDASVRQPFVLGAFNCRVIERET